MKPPPGRCSTVTRAGAKSNSARGASVMSLAWDRYTACVSFSPFAYSKHHGHRRIPRRATLEQATAAAANGEFLNKFDDGAQRRRALGMAPDQGTAEIVHGVEIGAGRSNLSPSEIERPRILLRAGLEAEALEELNRLFVRARGRNDRLALAQLYADAGDYNRPQRLMVDAYAESLARGPAPQLIQGLIQFGASS